MPKSRCSVGMVGVLCLKRGHLGRNCRSSYHCCTCSGRHHDSICAPQQIKTTNNSPEASGMQAPPPPVETTSGLEKIKSKVVIQYQNSLRPLSVSYNCCFPFSPYIPQPF